ncbi:MAG: hypothetical protein ABSB78_02620 [Bacteroidota bacterium]
MNRIHHRIQWVCVGWLIAAFIAFAQVENVQINNPVYTFLKRMEVKGIITKYHDGFLSFSRAEVAQFLQTINQQREHLTATEREMLDDFKTEFAQELHLQDVQRTVLFSDSTSLPQRLTDLFRWKEKYLYTWQDSTTSLFVNFLFAADFRSGNGNTYGNTTAETERIGGRIRGTIGNHFGYFLQGTNGLVFGDKIFVRSDPRLRENYKLSEPNSNSFDEVEGYVKLHTDWLTLQVGRERLLWGNSLDSDGKLYISDNASPFDMIRFDAEYGIVKFSFIHGWLLSENKAVYNSYSWSYDTYLSPKYIAGHRIELSFPHIFDIAANEMLIYSRPSPELAYLNPLNFFKSAEHSLQDRDNSLLAFDMETHFLENLQFSGSILIDDMDFKMLGTRAYVNQFAYQAGAYYIEPAGLENTDIAVEYTRINPYVYSHHIPVNMYANHGFILGNPLGPNSDAWKIRVGYLILRQLQVDGSFVRERHGDNLIDANGVLITNVGGNALMGHRSGDAMDVDFLGGARTNTNRYSVHIVYQFTKNFFCETRYEYRLAHVTSPIDGVVSNVIDRYLTIQIRCDL